MSESGLSPKANFWRKVIRVCALGCLATTFVDDTSNLGGWWVLAWEYLFKSRIEVAGFILTDENGVGVFVRACGMPLFQVGFFTPVFLLVLFGKRFTYQSKPYWGVRLLSFLLFGLSFLIPILAVYGLARSMRSAIFNVEQDILIACSTFFVAMLILLLLLCGLFILLARDHRGTHVELPILATSPALMQFVYWSCVFVYRLWVPMPKFPLSILFAVLCASVNLVALVQYIRAIKASHSTLRHS